MNNLETVSAQVKLVKQSNIMGKLSLALGVLGFVFNFSLPKGIVVWLFAIIAINFGVTFLIRAKRLNLEKGAAITGIILAVINISIDVFLK